MRRAKLRTPGSDEPFYQALSDHGSLTRRAFSSPSGLYSPSQMNDPKVRRYSLPSLGGIGTAGALARFYQTLCSDEIFSAEMIRRIAATQCTGQDEILRIDTAFGIGFMKDPHGWEQKDSKNLWSRTGRIRSTRVGRQPGVLRSEKRDRLRLRDESDGARYLSEREIAQTRGLFL